MAKVVDKFTGSFSGKLGDVVFRRYKNGSVFVARQKSVKTVSYSEKCINTRNNFKVAVGFAKVANKLPDIHTVWKNSRYEGRSPYTKILKSNIAFVNKNLLPGKSTKLTPGGFGIDMELLSISNEKICLNLSLPEFSKHVLNLKLKLNIVLALYNPVKSDIEMNFTFIADSTDIVFTDLNNFHAFELIFGSMNNDAISEYKNTVIFFALTNTESSVHIFSKTFHADSVISKY